MEEKPCRRVYRSPTSFRTTFTGSESRSFTPHQWREQTAPALVVLLVANSLATWGQGRKVSDPASEQSVRVLGVVCTGAIAYAVGSVTSCNLFLINSQLLQGV